MVYSVLRIADKVTLVGRAEVIISRRLWMILAHLREERAANCKRCIVLRTQGSPFIVDGLSPGRPHHRSTASE